MARPRSSRGTVSRSAKAAPKAAPTCFLGIDVGTSAVKATLVDEKGRIKGAASQSHPLATPHPGWAEQKPQDWWSSTVGAIKKVLRVAKVPAARVASVGLSGQMHSSVFLDGKNAVIRPALLWCDGRTTKECQEIQMRVGEEQLARWVANPALEGFTLPKVLWLRNHEPAAWARLAKVVLAKDYVRFRLTGVLASEPSDASATLMYDTANRRWSEPLMKALDLDMSLLPELGASTDVLGTREPRGRQAHGARRRARPSSAAAPTTPAAPSASGWSRPAKPSRAGAPRAPC